MWGENGVRQNHTGWDWRSHPSDPPRPITIPTFLPFFLYYRSSLTCSTCTYSFKCYAICMRRSRWVHKKEAILTVIFNMIKPSTGNGSLLQYNSKDKSNQEGINIMTFQSFFDFWWIPIILWYAYNPMVVVFYSNFTSAHDFSLMGLLCLPQLDVLVGTKPIICLSSDSFDHD